METEKIICTEGGCNQAVLSSLLSNQGRSSELMALANNGGLGGNNGLMWLLLVLLLGGNNLYGRNGNALQDSEIMTKLNSMSGQMNSNQSTNTILDALKGNGSAIQSLAQTTGCSFGQVQTAIASIDKGIAIVAGQSNTNKEAVVNAILLGNKDITATLTSCCCDVKESILKGNYDNQIATLNQTTQLQERLTGIANGIQQGFSATAYETQAQTCALQQSIKEQGELTRKMLSDKWNNDLALALQDEKFKNSQLLQNQYIADQIKSAMSSSCGCSCCR